MLEGLRKLVADNKEIGLAFILAALSFIILILPITLKRPLAKYTHIVTLAPFQSVSEDLKRLVNTAQEYRDRDGLLLKMKYDFGLEALRQNARLRDSLGFKRRTEYRLIPAELEAIDPKRRDNAIIVSIKDSREVMEDMAVISLQGLVGKTTNVLNDNVTVELLTSPNCRVAARDQNTRTLGIIKWRLGQHLFMDNVPVRDKVNIGDTIISSGLGGLFPTGLPIGVVEDVKVPERGFFKHIRVRPFVNFNRLDEMFILKDMEG
jgi:rod shape-determining protein MreC